MNSEGNSCGTRTSGLRETNLNVAGANFSSARGGAAGIDAGTLLTRIPEGVRARAASKVGEYDARRLRSQMEIIRDVMQSAADCGTWLTLGELRGLTRFGEASISAQLRHLRKSENGGYELVKRHREGALPERAGADGRGECVWEYRLGRVGTELGAAPLERGLAERV